MWGEMETEHSVSDSDIANEALVILQAPEQHGRAILLSYLGGRLSAKYAPAPWRRVMGGRNLRHVLDRELGNRIAFEGEGSQIAVALAPETAIGAPTPRFDKTAWAAFAKPIAPGFRRVLYPTRPIRFNDEPGDLPLTIKTGGFEVEPHLVPDAAVPRPARDRMVHESIKQWCALQEVEISILLEDTESEAIAKSNSTTPTRPQAAPGLIALERLISAIPSAERKNFSLPLDLLHRLISSS
jgi:hypothetical protein